MRNFIFIPIEECDLKQYKADMQEEFQKGIEEDFGESEEIILPEEDMERRHDVVMEQDNDEKMERDIYMLLKSAELEEEETEKRYSSQEVFAVIKEVLNVYSEK